MKFYDFTTLRERERKVRCKDDKSLDEILKDGAVYVDDSTVPSLAQFRHLKINRESRWVKNNRPFYNVWPIVLRPLSSAPMNIRGDQLELPIDPLLLRFSQGSGFPSKTKEINTAFIYTANWLPVGKEDIRIDLNASFDFGESVDGRKSVHHLMITLDVLKLEECITQAVEGSGSGDLELFQSLMRLIVAVCGLDKNSGVFKPEVLNRDREKFKKTGDLKHVEKAKRYGIYGFSLGADEKVSPHWRQGHLAWRWYGRGRRKKRLVWIDETFINRKLVAEVPTGFMEE